MAKKHNDFSRDIASDQLFEDIATLIDQSRRKVALVVNHEITLLYWQIGKLIDNKVLKSERTAYGDWVHKFSGQLLNLLFGSLANARVIEQGP